MVSDNESPVVLCLRRITQPILFFQLCTSLDTTLAQVTPMMFGLKIIHTLKLGGIPRKLILADGPVPPSFPL